MDNCDNSLFGPTKTASEEILICSSVVEVATFIQLVVGRLAPFINNCLLTHDD